MTDKLTEALLKGLYKLADRLEWFREKRRLPRVRLPLEWELDNDRYGWHRR